MATADDYAKWIVANADKKGTQDFNTVVAAYQHAKDEEAGAAQQQQPIPGVTRSEDFGGNTYGPMFTGAGNRPNLNQDQSPGRILGEAGRRFLGGVEQLGDKAIDAVTGSDYGDQQTQAETQRRAAFDAAHPNEGGPADLLSGAVPIGGVFGAARRTTTAMAALWRSMVAGGSIAATQFTPAGQSKTGQVVTGALLPAAGQAVAGAVPAVRNVVGRMVQSAEENPRVQAVVQAGKGFFRDIVPARVIGKPNSMPSAAVPNPNPYTVGQASGSPVLERLEGRAYGSHAQEFQAQQADQAAARFSELADQAANVSKLDTSAQGVASAVNRTLDNTLTGMRTARNAGFKAGMTRVVNLAGPGGGPGLVPLTNLNNEYQAILREDGNAFNLHGTTLPASVKQTAETLSAAMATGPTGVRVKVPYLQRIMEGLGQDAPHGAGVVMTTADRRVEMYRARLRAALDKDIDAAGIKQGTNPAFDALQQTRKVYAQQSDAIRQVEDSSLSKLFGGPDALASPQAALDKFHQMPAADQRAAVNLLQANHPEVLDAMRAQRIRQAIQTSTTNGAAKNSEFDLAAFNKEMFAGDRAKSPLWGGDVTSGKVREGAAHLRVLLNATGRGPGSVIGPEDVAINLVSLTPAFIARGVTRALYGTQGDRLLGTPEGLAALRTLSDVTQRKTQAGLAAMGWIMHLGGTQQQQAPAGAQ